jgi:FAD-NAD(P)-binding
MLPEFIDLAIVGAGPHALTLVTHLLQKKKSMRGRFLAFDPSGTWMKRWHHQFATFEIPHLRSPAVHQPDPNPHALRTFAAPRPDELIAPYDLPGTQLFRDFCQETVRRWQLADCVYPAQVVRVEPTFVGGSGAFALAIASPAENRDRARFCLHLSNGQTIIARRVVIANGGAVPNLPEWVGQVSPNYPQDRLLHSHQVDLRGLHLQGERVLIVGGGLTSGHLALGAVQRGAQVLLMSRRNVYGKLFDADPGWIGPKYLKGFWAEPDLHTRWQMIQQARNGGSMTPMVLSQLRRLEREGKIEFYEQCGVSQAKWSDKGWQIHCDNLAVHECIHHQNINRIWVATGSQLDARNHPLLHDVLAAHPIEVVNGLPVVDEHLRWQGCELFIMGGLAALRVGPAARNLSGARAASDRIVPALTKSTITSIKG